MYQDYVRMFIFRTGTALVVVSQGVVEPRQLRLQHQRQQQDQQLRQHPLGAVTCNYELSRTNFKTSSSAYKVELSSPVR